MKLIYLFFLSAILLMTSSANTLLLVDYKYNKAYYEALCVNKDKPEMDCHGKCELKKESEQNSSPVKMLKIAIEFNILPPNNINLPLSKEPINPKEREKLCYITPKISEGYSFILPQPPQI